MFEDLVSNLLSDYLGDYLEGLTKDDLNISLWKGDLKLKNLRIKKDALDAFCLPIQVKDGFVGKLTLKIPWKNFGKKPTEVFLDDVYLIACPKLELEFDAKKEEKRKKESKRAQLKALEESEKQLMEEMKMKENKSSTAKFMAKILDNFQLHVNRIHLRYEDHSSCKSHHFAAGIILEKLYVNSDQVLGEKQSSSKGVFDKKLELKKFGIYWDVDNTMNINTDSIDSLKAGMRIPFQNQVPKKMEGLSPREFLLFPISLELRLIVDMRKAEERKPSMEDAISAAFLEFHFSKEVQNAISESYRHSQKKEQILENCRNHFFSHLSKKHPKILSSTDSNILHDLFNRCWEIEHTASAIVAIDGNLDSFVFTLEYEQFVTLTEFVSGLSIQSTRSKYRPFRPIHENVEKFPREWWKFAIQSIIQNNRENRRHQSWREFQNYKARREEYILLYKRKQGMKPSLKKDPKGLVRLQKLEDSFSIQEIQIFRQLALSQLSEESEGKKKSLYALRKTPSPVADDEKRREIWSQFDIDPDESPWEGETPNDVQFQLDFRIHTIRLDLRREEKDLISVTFEDVGVFLMKCREFLQCWCWLQNCSLQYLRNVETSWKHIIHPERREFLSDQKSALFLPNHLRTSLTETPFLQLFIENPSSKEGVMQVKGHMLPLSLVGNVECVLDAVTFFSDPLFSLHLDGFLQRESNLSFSQKRRIRIAREMSSHRKVDMDVYVGPIHVLLPEDPQKAGEGSYALMIRFNELTMRSKQDYNKTLLVEKEDISPRNMDHLDRFDRFELFVKGVSLLLIDDHVHWMNPSTPKETNYSLIDDFEIRALIGQCITPSDISLPNQELTCHLFQLRVSLQQSQYVALLRWAEGFDGQLKRMVKRFAQSMLRLSKVTKKIVEWMWADLEETENSPNQVNGADGQSGQNGQGGQSDQSGQNKQILALSNGSDNRGYSEDELAFLFAKPTVSMNLVCPGVSLLLENEDTVLGEFQLRGFSVSLLERAFDIHVDITMNELVGKDVPRSEAEKKETFFVMSKGINSLEKVDETTQNQLIHVTVDVVKRVSPRFSMAPSHVTVGINLGPLSVVLFPPSILRLFRFFLPITTQQRNSFADETPHLNEEAMSFIHRQIHRILHQSPFPRNWEQNSVSVSVSLQKIAVLLISSSSLPLLFGQLQEIALIFAVSPSRVYVQLGFGGVSLDDVSKGNGQYPSILSIVPFPAKKRRQSLSEDEDSIDSQEFDPRQNLSSSETPSETPSNSHASPSFVDLEFTLFTSTVSPLYRGYRFALKGTIRAFSLVFRARWVDELVKFVTLGPLGELQRISRELKRPSPKAHSALLSSLYASAIQVGKEWIHENEWENTKAIIPLLDLCVENFVITIPESSESKETAVFELGQFRIQNQVDSRTAVFCSLEEMRAYTCLSSSPSQALMGGVSCTLQIIIGATTHVLCHVTRLAIAVNESQLAFFARCSRQNLKEKAVICTGELFRPVKHRSADNRGFFQNPFSFIHSIAATVSLEGVNVELLQADGSYIASTKGNAMYNKAGTLPNSFLVVDVRQLQFFYRFLESTHSMGVSLASITIRDSIRESFICKEFQIPFRFGGDAMPAFSATFSIRKRKRSDFKELDSYNMPESEEILEYHCSAHVGTLRIIATPWIFSIAEIGTKFARNIIHEFGPKAAISAAPLYSKNVRRNVLIEVRMDHPYLFFVEDSSDKNSPSFLFSFSADLCAHFSPTGNLDGSFSLLGIRGCRGNLQENELPQPSVMDALHPCDIIMNAHWSDLKKSLSGTLVTSERVVFRLGILDLRLLLNAMQNLVKNRKSMAKEGTTLGGEWWLQNSEPQNGEIGETGEMGETEETMENLLRFGSETPLDETPVEQVSSPVSSDETPFDLFSYHIQFMININKIAVILVNDASDAQIPVVNLCLSDTAMQWGVSSDRMKLSFQSDVEAGSYNPRNASWEPVVESTNLIASLQCEKRYDMKPVSFFGMQLPVKSEFRLETGRAINVNLSSICTQSLLRCLHSFQTTRDSRLHEELNYFIAVRNASGLPVGVQVKDDGGVSNLMDDASSVLEDSMDRIFFSGIAEIVTENETKVCWVEFHELVPLIRVFSSIPFVKDAEKSRYFGSKIQLGENSQRFPEFLELNKQIEYEEYGVSQFTIDFLDFQTSSVLFPVLSFTNESPNFPGTAVQLFVGSLSEQEKWIRFSLQLLSRHVHSFCATVSPTSVEETTTLHLHSKDSTQITTLPAHPSLILQQLGLPYRRFRKRSLLVMYEGLPGFECDVDGMQEQAILLDSRDRGEMKVVVHSEVKDGRKVVTVGSTISVTNESHCVIRCRIEEEEKELGHDDTIYVPITAVDNGAIELRVSESKTISCRLIQSNQATGTINLGSSINPVFLSVYNEIKKVPILGMPGEMAETYHLILSDIIQIENCLPEALEVGVKSASDQLLAIFMLRPGKREMISGFKFLKKDNQRICLRLAERTFEFSDFRDSIAPSKVVPWGFCTIYDENTGSKLRLRYTMKLLKYNSWFLQIFCDYWLLNKTGLDLLLTDDEDVTYTTFSPSSPLDIRESSSVTCSLEPLHRPTLFSLAKPNHNSIRIRLCDNDSVWSEAFRIDVSGVDGVCYVPTPGAEPPIFSFTVSISRAPGIFARSFVVTISPFFTLINKMRISLRIRSDPSSDPILLKPSNVTPFHCDFRGSTPHLQVSSPALPFGWSTKFPLTIGRFILQLPPSNRDRFNLSSRLFEPFPDPSLYPSSLIKVEITAENGIHFAVLHSCDASDLPFCVTNRSALDELILRQRGVSWDASLIVKPFQSVMWTMPKCDGEPLVDVYSRGIGLPWKASSLEAKFTFDASQSGDLGSFEVDAERLLTIQNTLQKTVRFLVFQPLRGSGSRQSSLITDKLLLVDRQNHLDNHMLNETPDASATYVSFVQLLYCFAAEGIFPFSTSVRLDVQTDSQYRVFQSGRGSFPFLGQGMILPLGSALGFTMEVAGNSAGTEVLHGLLSLQDFRQTDKLFEVVIPCYEGSKTKAYCVALMANVPAGNEQQRFETIRLQKCREEIASVIQSVTTEFKLERSFSRRNMEMYVENSIYLRRATHVGIWKYPTLVSPVDIEETSVALTNQRAFLRLCIHEVKRLRNASHRNMYFLVESRKTKQRSPSSNQWFTDLELQTHPEVRITNSSLEFGCSFTEKEGQFVVSQVLRNSLAARSGVCVGHVLVLIDGEMVPPTLYELKQRANQNSNSKVFVFRTLDPSYYEKVVMNQSVVLYDETLEFQELVTVSLLMEGEEKDEYLWSFKLDISEEKNMELEVGGNCISFETHWESFEEKEDSILEAIIQIPGLGVSLVSSVPEEIGYVSITKMEGKIQVMENGRKVFSMQMNSIQIDNQLKRAKYDVILDTPSEEPWFSLMAKTQPNSSVHYLEYFAVQAHEVRLFIESGMIVTLMEFAKELPFDLFDSTEIDCLKQLNENPLFIQPLLIPDMQKNSQTVFVEHFELHPLHLTVTCTLDPSQPIASTILPDSRLLIPFQAMIDTIGTFFGNVDAASIHLTSFVTENLFMSENQFLSQLATHYTHQILKKIFTVVGSSSLLGNPIGLFESLGSGVKAFLTEPIQGLSKGPEEFFDGLGKGTKSLLLNTTYGITNSAAKITGTLGNGISTIGTNDSYRRDRAAGKSGIVYGVKEGVLGVFRDSVNGAKENGLIGALAGTGKGIVGLLTKPVAGVFDDTTKIIETVKDATRVFIEPHRKRIPRYIYPDGVLTSYCEYLSRGRLLLLKLMNLHVFDTAESYLVHVIDNYQNTLLVTTRRSVLVSALNHVLWSIPHNKIDYVTHEMDIVEYFVDSKKTVVLVQTELIAINLCRIIDILRWEITLDLSLSIKEIGLFYGENLTEEEMLLIDQMKYDTHLSSSNYSGSCMSSQLDFSMVMPQHAIICGWHRKAEVTKNSMFLKSFMEYEIQVGSDAGYFWLIHRSFHDFENLHKSIVKIKGNSGVRGLRLPPKRLMILNKVNKKTSDSFVEQLNVYLQSLLSNDELCQCSCVDEFFKKGAMNVSTWIVCSKIITMIMDQWLIRCSLLKKK